MAAVEWLVGVADFAQLLDADAAGQAMKFLGEREHQRDGELGAGDIGAAADGEHLDAFGSAGVGVDVAGAEAVFLHDAQLAAGGKLLVADAQRFDHQRGTARQCRAHLALRLDEPHLTREKPPDAGAHALAVAVEIGLVVGEEIGIGGGALGRRIRIEHDADDAQERPSSTTRAPSASTGRNSERTHGARGSRSS